MSVRRLLMAGGFALLLLLGAGPRPAAATAQISDGTAPADGETVQPPGPTNLLLVFSEPLTDPPRVVMQTSAGATVPLGEVGRGDDDQTWIIPIVGALASDVYRVTWTAGGATGNYQFTVAGGTTDTTTATTTQDPSATTAVGTATTVATTTTSGAASAGDGVAPP